MPPTPLPPAYDACLTLESHLLRLLGYLLLYAPNPSIRRQVAKCIHSHSSQNDLIGFGASFECHVIAAYESHYRSLSKSERPHQGATRGKTIAEIKDVPQHHKNAEEQALIHDNRHSVVTGILDINAPADIKAACDPSIYHTYTDCAHIIPDATFFSVSHNETDSTKPVNSAFVLSILNQFYDSISNFNRPNVHSLPNVMTMERNIHEAFDQLELYFEATKEPDYYKVISYHNLPNKHDKVIFTTPDPEKLPLPSSRLLALHATCCKVAHLSGSTEYIDKLFRDAERIGVLANDGASADLLQYMLLPLVKSASEFCG